MCLKGFHPPEMQGCWHEGRWVDLLTFYLSGRKFDQSFLWVFLLFSFTKWPNLWCNTCVTACAKRKRPPLVRGQHWSPARVLYLSFNFVTVFYPVPNRVYVRVCCDLYECLWLHFLSIVELTNYSCTKHRKAFYRSACSLLLGYIM